MITTFAVHMLNIIFDENTVNLQPLVTLTKPDKNEIIGEPLLLSAKRFKVVL